MAEVIDLVSSDDEVVDASAVIAGFCETRGTRVRLSNSSQDSSPIASLTTTVAAGAEGRFVVSDCDGHKRIESTHVENHFEQDHSIFTQDFSRREDITEDRDVPKDSSGISSFVTAPSTLARINGSNDDDDLRLRLSLTMDEAELSPEVASVDKTPKTSKDQVTQRTPMTASALFSIGKRKSVGWALQRASVLAGGSDEEDEEETDGPKEKHQFSSKKNQKVRRRKSVLGKNDVFLLPSDSDSENDDDTSIMIRPLPTSPKIRQDNVRTWVATSPFSSPRLSPKKFQEESDLNDESRSGDTGTTDEICRIMEQSACTSNQQSAKNILTESSLITEDEDTSVPVSACYTEDKVCQISLSGSDEMEAGGETSAPISNTDTIDKALQISLGSDYDSSPAIVSTKAKPPKNKKLSIISSSSEDENETEGNENDGNGSVLLPSCSPDPSSTSYWTAPVATSHDHSEGQLRKSARKPPAKESGKLKGYFQRLKEEKERRRMKHEAKRKGEVVLDFGIRSLDSIPDKESDNDGSSDSSDKSAENSPERRRGAGAAGAAVVPRKLQFSPSERDDDGDGGERRMKGKGARAVSSGEEEQVEDEDAYEPSFIDDGDEARESDSESLSDSDPSVDDGENASPANWRSTSPRATPKTKGKGAARIPLSELNNGQQQPPVLLTFLQSLSLPRPNERCHPEAIKFIKHYPKHRNELARILFDLYNGEVFAGGIQGDTEIVWKPRLTKTAGMCAQKQRTAGGKVVERFSVIELSSKVLDSPDRLRDTLIHEMCHAAAWIISGYPDGHGPLFKDWARRAMAAFPELPVIARCHNYVIRTKYTYRCVQCACQIGRHSKSLDAEKWRCGKCGGRFELYVNHKSSASSATPGRRLEQRTPRAPNPFAAYVKEHYAYSRTPGKLHADVMKELAAEFKATKIKNNK